MATKKSSSSGGWSALPTELLLAIFERLTYVADHVRSRAVCSSWRAVDITPARLQALPWMTARCCHAFGFFDIFATSLVHRLDRAPPDLDKYCCGSSQGWLALLDRTPLISLLNPVTGAELQLPPLPGVSREGDDEYVFTDVIGCRFRSRGSFKQMQYLIASKVIMSSSPLEDGCVVMAACRVGDFMIFCRPGGDSWTVIIPTTMNVDDLLFYEGRFYACSLAVIAACDLESATIDDNTAMSLPPSPDPDVFAAIQSSYLAESSGDLLLVAMSLRGASFEFEVYKVNDYFNMQYTKLESLGDRALFLGYNQSISLSSSDFPECKGNCIYFLEYGFDLLPDVGVYDLEDRSTKFISNYQADPPLNWEPVVWMTPSLL